MRYIIAFCSLLLIGSCVKQEFDNPPEYEVTLEPNTTIAELKALYTDFSQSYIEIEDDIVISGVVVASDRSGNLYRTIVIQDETAGLYVNIFANELHADFPVGREVFIDCQGLVLGDYAGLKQLGGSYSAELDRINGIEEVLIEDYIQRGDVIEAPEPATVSITEAASGRDYLGRLIHIEGVEFIPSDTAETYATIEYDPVTGEEINESENRILSDCDGNELIMRNSGFADFALQPLPDGNGPVTGILSIFAGDYQLVIRDTSDVQLSGTRCGGTGDAELISIQEVRDLYTGSASTLPANKKIRGVVTSDQEHENITSRNLVIQEEGGAGIVVRFVSDHNYSLGTDLEINIGGAELSEFNGWLQINNVDNVRTSILGMTDQPTAQNLSIQEILADFESLESELVTIENARISKESGNTYSGVTALDDGTATMDMYTTSYATFADQTFPTDTVTITGIVSQGGTQQSRQLSIRYPELDIEGGNGGGGGDDLFFEDFQAVGDAQDINLSGWTNIAVQGTRVWRGDAFSGDVSAQATAFNDEAPQMESWLVTPAISLDEAAELTFESATAYWTHDALTVFISTDFSGDPTSATWEEMNVNLAGEAQDNYDIVESGPVDLSSYTGNTIFIGFRYMGSGPNEMTSTYQVDDIKVSKQ